VSESRAGAHDARPPWVRRLLITLGLALLIVVAIFLGAAFLPRWWAHRVAAQAGSNFTAGIALGLAYGFSFTVVPLVVLQWAFRKRRPLRTWAAMVGAALLLAMPNLLTLGIVVGTGNAAHAGERTLDVEAPGFRAATLAGVISAAGVFLVGGYLLTSRRRARERLERLRKELRSSEEAGAAEVQPRPE
jgi:MFS family permease